MDRQHIQDQQVIERYLAGQLGADEERAFEEYYMSDPELLEEVQIAERLKQGLQALSDAGELARTGSPSGWRNLFRSPIYAAAASILAAVSIVFSGVIYMENLSLRSGTLQARNPVATRINPLISVRGRSENEITAADDDEWTVLLVDAGFTPYDRYRASVTRSDGADTEQVWQLGDLLPTSDGQIAIGLPGSLLIPGEYEVLLEGRMDDWPADRSREEISRMRVTVSPELP